MTAKSFAIYLTPWRLGRAKAQQQLDALRRRDGDDCRRCRRPMRFDLPRGHDKAPIPVSIGAAAGGAKAALDSLVLCHTRCNPGMVDHTAEVQERLQAREEPRRDRGKRRRVAA